MGLDMYLYGIVDKFGETDVGTVPIKESWKVGYWRKANQIHNWFVNNVQGGVDDCNYYSVCKDDLNDLKEICLKVLEDKTLASKLLPTTSGFFFGCTDYNENYFRNLEYTVELINLLLNNNKFQYYEYYSSW